MVPDWVAWWALSLAAFAVIGVAYLIFQSLVETIPRLSFKLDVEGVVNPLKGNFGVNRERTVAFLFTIWNRTSQPQRMQCTLAALGEDQLPGVISYWLWARVEHWDIRTQQPINPRDFEVSPGDGRQIAIQGDLRPEVRVPGTLTFYVGDSRLGRHHWEYQGGYEFRTSVARADTSEIEGRPPV